MVNALVEIDCKKYEDKPFTNDNVEIALENSQSDNYRPLFMPRLVDQRIKSDGESVFWKRWFSTPSLRATGKTSQGNKIVVYAHVDNYLSNPDNIKEAKRKGLVNYAGRIPQEEFQRLANLNESKDEKGNRLVWVVDYEKLRKASSKVIPVDSALEHLQTIPFLGGEERARVYLEKHKEILGNEIGNWYRDDFSEEDAIGRLLYLGSNSYFGLSSDYSLDNFGCFFGVRELSAEGASQKIEETKKVVTPNLEEILVCSKPFIPEKLHEEYEKGIKKLYKK